LHPSRRARSFAVAGGALLTGLLVATPAGTAASQSALSSSSFVETWSVGPFPDTGQPIAESSPMVADLDGQPSAVVGDRTGYLYAYHLSDGTAVMGWPVFDGGTPIDSTPSVAALSGGTLDSVFVGTGNAQFPGVGGYEAYGPQGQLLWHTNVTDPSTDNHPAYGVQASLTFLGGQGGTEVFAGSLDQEAYALTATSGSVAWPFFTADSVFSTAAEGDLYGDGQDELVVGGASTAGLAMGESYPRGGHVRVISAQGTLLYDYDTNQQVDSSPAVGDFLAQGATGIAVGTGSYWPGASDTDTIKAFTTRLAPVWSEKLDGATSSSPALADVQGQGLDVVEGTDTGTTGSAWVLDGATGAPIWEETVTGRVIGSVVTADLAGGGYQDLLVPTTHGVEVLDGRGGAEVSVLRPDLGFQNAPLVTDDPNGTIGITVAGYDGLNEGVIAHYEIPGSNGALAVGSGSWPMFHHDQTLSGVSAPLPDPGTLTPTALAAQGGNAQVSLSWAAPPATGGPAATGYNVYEGTAPGHEAGTPINGPTPVTGTNYVATDLSNGTKYYFEVTALNSAGEGSPSGEASATPTAGPPGAPNSLSATAGDSEVSLSWAPPSSDGGSALTGYNLYESTAAGVGGDRVLTGTAATSYSITGLVNATTYYFEVTAVNSAGEGPASAQASATPSPSITSTTTSTTATTTGSTTSSPPTPPPATSSSSAPPTAILLAGAPGAVQTPVPTRPAVPAPPVRLAAAAGNTEVSLSWAAPSGRGRSPKAYDVYVSTMRGAKGTEVAAVQGTGYTVTGLTDGTTYYFEVTAVGTGGPATPSTQVPATPTRPTVAPGYRLATTAGQVFTLGPVPAHKATSYSSAPPASPVVAIVSTPDGRGYWLALRDGDVVAAGDAHIYGPTAARHSSSPVTGLAVSPDGRGYWLATAAGQVLGFGDARTYAASGGGPANGPVAGIAATADGHGYWLVSAGGGVLAFGDARIYPSTGATRLNQRIVGIAASTDGRGYWILTSSGGVFGFGDAHFYGSLAARRLNQPVVGIAATSDGRGYWVAASDGGVFCFGDAPFFGPVGSGARHQRVVGITL
jgi:fibronectin type 3 domain-containing protein